MWNFIDTFVSMLLSAFSKSIKILQRVKVNCVKKYVGETLSQ